MQIIPEQIKNILILRNDRFGEFLLNIPALRALKESFKNCRIIALVDPYVKELAQSISFIDEVIEWGRRKHPLMEKLRLINLLKRKNISIAVVLNPSKELNILTFLAGIPIRVGYNRKLGFLLTHKMEDKKCLGQKHEVEYNLELVRLAGAKTDNNSLSLALDNNVSGEPNIDGSGNLVALHPWTSDPVKQWPERNFCELAKRLIKELNAQVVIIGGEVERGKSAQLFDNLDTNLNDLTGKTTLKQLAAILKKCKLLVSCDSGPMHLACALGIPVVAIFRNDISGKTAKRWGPWGKGHIVIEKNNLSGITVEEVFNKIKEILSRQDTRV